MPDGPAVERGECARGIGAREPDKLAEYLIAFSARASSERERRQLRVKKSGSCADTFVPNP